MKNGRLTPILGPEISGGGYYSFISIKDSITKLCNDFWNSLKGFRGQTKTNNEPGKRSRYYEKDYTRGDIEVYDKTGKQLGSADPKTGEMTKPPVKRSRY